MKDDKIRKGLHKYIDNADEETLHFLNEAAQAYAKKEQTKENKLKFDPNATYPMTLQEYYEMIEQAEENIRNGNVYTEKEANAIMDSWDEEDK